MDSGEFVLENRGFLRGEREREMCESQGEIIKVIFHSLLSPHTLTLFWGLPTAEGFVLDFTHLSEGLICWSETS